MITGLNGCSCHPFPNWKECEKAHKQKFKVGDPVKNRCTGKQGIVNKIDSLPGYISVKYGKFNRDIHGEHVAQLIRL